MFDDRILFEKLHVLSEEEAFSLAEKFCQMKQIEVW